MGKRPVFDMNEEPKAFAQSKADPYDNPFIMINVKYFISPEELFEKKLRRYTKQSEKS